MKKNRLPILIVTLILAVGLFLRIFNVGHVLSYDEAWNANTVTSVAEGSSGDVFFNNYYRHPPIYNSIGVLVKFITGDSKNALAATMEIISILFSLGLMLMLFFCGREWFGLEAGIFAAILFALMPAARVYDTFIKPESLTLLFCLLFVFFFFKDRYVVGGVFLGLAALSKETFIFVLAAMLVFLLVTWWKKRFRGFAISVGIAAFMSFWWYLFLSNSKGEFLDFFLGRSQEALNWGRSWNYFISRIPRDIGWVILVLGAVALGLFIYELLETTYKRDELREDNPLSMALFCFIWIIVTYLVISIAYGKPPWMVYSALPAIALLGGWSMQEILQILEDHEALGYSVVAGLLVLAFVLSVITGFGSFMKAADPTFEGAEKHKRVAEYINENDGDQSVMLRVNDFSPNLAFYLDSYQPGNVYEFPVDMAEMREVPDPEKYKIFLLNKDTESGELLSIIEKYPPDFFIVRKGIPTSDGIDVSVLLGDYIEPVIIENIRIFKGDEILKEIEEGYL